MEKKYSFFVDSAETPTAELGSGFIQSYLGSGTISKGFVVATERRAYFKGKSYYKDLKGNWKKQMQEKTVDLKDITGTGYTSMRQLWMLITGIGGFFWPYIMLFISDVIVHDRGFQHFIELVEYNGMVNVYGGLIPLAIFLILYFLRRRTLFTIEFAGGSISFNTSWYSKEEVDNFQKNLRKAMAAIKDTEPTPTQTTVPTYTAPSSSIGAAKEKAEALREYAQLKEDGIISEEEFQQMKVELVSNSK